MVNKYRRVLSVFFWALRQHSLLYHILPDGPSVITLCWGHVSLLGQANTKWLPRRARPRPLSLISGGFIRTLPDETSFQHFVPFDDTSSFFQSITPACPASAGSCLACRVQRVWWQVTKRCACGPSAQHQGGRQAGGKCLNLKFTTQVTGSLQLSSNDAAIRVTMSTCTPSPSFHLHVWLLTR